MGFPMIIFMLLLLNNIKKIHCVARKWLILFLFDKHKFYFSYLNISGLFLKKVAGMQKTSITFFTRYKKVHSRKKFE